PLIPIGLPPLFSCFPYTTLFRSLVVVRLPAPGHADGFVVRAVGVTVDDLVALIRLVHHVVVLVIVERDRARIRRHPLPHSVDPRSEEHTSELQSRENLVCRLLLE